MTLPAPYIGLRYQTSVVVTPKTICAPTSFWNVPLADDAPLTGEAQDFPAQVTNTNRATINTTSYSCPITVVDSTVPRVPVRLVDRSGNDNTKAIDQALRHVLATDGVPIPADWVAPDDSDQEGCFYDPAADTVWELFQMRKDANGVWTCVNGGRAALLSTNPGYFRNRLNGATYSSTTGWTLPDGSSKWATFEQKEWGATATSALLIAGTISEEDIKYGSIEHGLGISSTFAHTKKGYRAPAQRYDGSASIGLPEGARLRLPVNYPVPQGVHPICAMVIQAASRYGFMEWDQAGSVSLRAEPAVHDYFDGTAPSLVLAGFPWVDLQVLA